MVRCSQIFSGVLGCYPDVLLMPSGYSPGVLTLMFSVLPCFQDVLMVSDQLVFSNNFIVFDYQKEFDDPQVYDGLKVISNESILSIHGL